MNTAEAPKPRSRAAGERNAARIAELLDRGTAPREIARELNLSETYVYEIRRQVRKSA